ncbi:MAG: SDR family oxidoreductase [Bacteroidales bacterium]|jgi:NAD(P)-dependent dehydrogenase (short-subunit alcohol dehydrogenase family)|nr:SDR family oxidoreductase [Bacteroidales bacterium]
MENNPFSLKGKKILVTGASSGIGRATSVQCANMGANIIVTGRNNERLQETMNMLAIGEHHCVEADITTDSGIFHLTDNVEALDGIVHCAGINTKFLFKFIDMEKINTMYAINCFSPMLMLQSFIKKKKINKGASIVLLSSISSNYATVSNALYASTKGAVNSLIRVLALELSAAKIRVNGIMPGMVKTEMMKSYGMTDDELDNLSKSYPLGKFGEPVDIANCAVYLLSEASCWVTGTNIVIDGGITLR